MKKTYSSLTHIGFTRNAYFQSCNQIMSNFDLGHPLDEQIAQSKNQSEKNSF